MSSVAEFKDFQAENVIGYVRALPPPLTHIGPGILPLKEVDSLKSIWEVVNVKVTAGHLLGLDSEIPLDSPPAIKEISQALCKIGKKRLIKEEEKAKLFRPRPGTRELATATDYVYNVLRLLSEGVDDRIEEMRWKALSVGTYSYSKYGVVIEADWGIPLANKPTADPVWSDVENADPLQDIIDWSEILINAVGSGGVAAYCSTKVWGYLLQNAKIRNILSYVQSGKGPAFGTKAQVMGLMLNGQGLPIIGYDSKFNEEAADTGISTLTRFLGDDKFVMLASAEGLSPLGLGDFALGPVPDANMASGKYADFYTKREPFSEIARCIAFGFPRIFVPGAIIAATVHE